MLEEGLYYCWLDRFVCDGDVKGSVAVRISSVGVCPTLEEKVDCRHGREHADGIPPHR
jgi:hypothetical protein